MASALCWEVGEFKISRIFQCELSLQMMARILPKSTPAQLLAIPWCCPHFVTPEGEPRGSVHSLVIDSGTRRVLVDTCVGDGRLRDEPDFHMLQTPFLANLKAAGYAPEDIDTVLCTHMHVDHVGWNTRWDEPDKAWLPTFPNAEYLFAEDEFRFWMDDLRRSGDKGIMEDSVQPIIDAGLHRLVSSSHVVLESSSARIRLIPTPGHTPGHVSVEILSMNETAVITGDCIHHPAQLKRPEWGGADIDRKIARKTRIELLESLAGTDTLLLGTHFAPPCCGHVRRDGGTFKLKVCKDALA